jgi:peptidyl-dipeptidase A
VTPAELVAACEARFEPLEVAANLAWWAANTEATDETQRNRAETEFALSEALADADTFAAIRAARASSDLDPVVARGLTLLEEEHTPHQLDPELRRRIIDMQSSIESRFSQHRGRIEGREVDDNEIAAILSDSDDSDERQAAWEASKTVGMEVAADVRELARLRNEAARRLGFRDHFALALATTEYDERKLFGTLEAVEEFTREPYRAMKCELDARLAARFGIAADAVRPWHYDDPFLQEVPSVVGVDLDAYLCDLDVDEVTIRTFGGMGLDVEPVLARSDLTPRSRKNQHAFCIDIDRSGDVRVLSNNVPGERWIETMLHECGHAVYFMRTGEATDIPWLLRTMHMCLTEGVAMRCGRLVREPAWLREIAGLPDDLVTDLAPKLAEAKRVALLVFVRWMLVMTHFERGLYANPDGPHDTRWWDLVERFQFVQRAEGRDAPDWAAKIHLALAPVYYHNYLFGELIACKLEATVGDLVNRPDAGAFLRERFFAPGAGMRWDRLIEHATGSALSPAVLADAIAN